MQKSRDWIEDRLGPRPRIIEGRERIGCGHTQPIALASFAIRWGMDASTNIIRERLRCSKCGRKGGVAIKRPSWDWRGYAVWPDSTHNRRVIGELN